VILAGSCPLKKNQRKRLPWQLFLVLSWQMSKVVKLTRENEAEVAAVVRDSKNELLKVGRVVNLSIKRGLPYIRRKYVKAKPDSSGAAERRAA
jgi:hypothetical protein